MTLWQCAAKVVSAFLIFAVLVLRVNDTQEQLLGFELLRECRMCFTQHQEFVKDVDLLLRSFAVQLIGSCDTVLVVLELMLATSSHRHQLR